MDVSGVYKPTYNWGAPSCRNRNPSKTEPNRICQWHTLCPHCVSRQSLAMSEMTQVCELAMKGSGDEADEEEEELTQNLQTLT